MNIFIGDPHVITKTNFSKTIRSLYLKENVLSAGLKSQWFKLLPESSHNSCCHGLAAVLRIFFLIKASLLDEKLGRASQTHDLGAQYGSRASYSASTADPDSASAQAVPVHTCHLILRKEEMAQEGCHHARGVSLCVSSVHPWPKAVTGNENRRAKQVEHGTWVILIFLDSGPQ